MRVTVNKRNPFPYVFIEDVFNKESLESIWKEAEFLCDPRKLNPPEKTGQLGKDKDGNPMKSNKGIWLEEAYANKQISNFLFHQRNIFSPQFIDYLKKQDFIFRSFNAVNTSHTLMSYYENADYYYAHEDSAVLTFVYWIYKEPKAFTGGDLVLTDLNETIKIKNNCGIIFPSYATHEVTALKMDDTVTEPNTGLGRFAFSTFFASVV